MMYQYADIPDMLETVENIDNYVTHDTNKSDFWRVGIEVYVGTFTDVSGPSFVIDPADAKGIAIFREFAAKLAAHYKSLTNAQP
jgi:hypothetical protein